MLSTEFTIDATNSSATLPLSTGVLSELVQIERLHDEWQGLYVRSKAQCLFLLPTWHAAWWRAFQGDSTAHIVVVRDANGSLIAIAPLQLRTDVWRGLRVRVLGTYNNEHASRFDFLIDPVHLRPAISAIVGYLASRDSKWDALHLRQIPKHAPWLDGFVEACQSAGLKPFAPTAGIAKCTVDVVGTWEDFLDTRTKHFRARLKENMRRVSKAGQVAYRRSSGAKEDFEVFKRLEQSSWKAQDASARLGEAGWHFQREIALDVKAGVRCHNLFLEIDGNVVGAIHVVGIGSRMYSMQMLFDESVRRLYPGRALFGLHIADMCMDEKTRILDLNGNSAFCQSWTDKAEQFLNLQVFNNNPYSRLLALLKKKWGRNR